MKTLNASQAFSQADVFYASLLWIQQMNFHTETYARFSHHTPLLCNAAAATDTRAGDAPAPPSGHELPPRTLLPLPPPPPRWRPQPLLPRCPEAGGSPGRLPPARPPSGEGRDAAAATAVGDRGPEPQSPPPPPPMRISSRSPFKALETFLPTMPSRSVSGAASWAEPSWEVSPVGAELEQLSRTVPRQPDQLERETRRSSVRGRGRWSRGVGKPLPSSSSSSSSPSHPRLLQSGSQAAAASGRSSCSWEASPSPCAAAGMGTPLAAAGLLLLLAGTAGFCRAFFSLPLHVSHPAAPSGSPPAPVVLRPGSSSRQEDPLSSADGLALASDPEGTLNFLAMVENLQGDAGRGYYLEMLIGTPPQAVGAGWGLEAWGGRGKLLLGGWESAAPRPKRNFLSVPGAGASLPSPIPSKSSAGARRGGAAEAASFRGLAGSPLALPGARRRWRSGTRSGEG